jgi:hypothetical protein
MFDRNMKVGIISGTVALNPEKMHSMVINHSVLPTEMLLRILLAGLAFISSNPPPQAGSTYFGRLANFLTDNLPLVRLVFFDRSKQRSTLLVCQLKVILKSWQVLTSSSANSA